MFVDENQLVCPYCGEVQQCHEPDDFSSDMCYTECEHCDKPFWYAVTVAREYTSIKDENDGEEDEDK